MYISRKKKEKLVVEVISAQNLMPKDGEGSCSPFVEVAFENQRQRTQVKHKDLNPVWNQKLVFPIISLADLPYRALDINVFNEKKSSNSRNFLGKIRIPGSSIPRETEDSVSPLPYTLEKRSLFSHIRGKISLKVYFSDKEDEETTTAAADSGNISFPPSASISKKKVKKLQQSAASAARMQQGNSQTHQIQQLVIPNPDPSPVEMKPIVVAGAPSPIISAAGTGVAAAGAEFLLKETSPHLGGKGSLSSRDKTSSTYDLVEQMQYLYVRIVKVRDLPAASGDATAQAKLGNYGRITKKAALVNNAAAWDQIFAFSKDCVQASMAEIVIKDRDRDDSCLGRILFDLGEVPKRAPPDSQLAPQWHRLEGGKTGEVMASIWFGTQADEAFAEAWHSKAASVDSDGLCSIKSKVYLSPKLWYLRVTVIEAQDVALGEKGSSVMRFPELSAKAAVGNQVSRTRIAPATAGRSFSSPYWNEDLMFVVAEPFEDHLLLSVEDRLAPGRDETVGRVLLPVNAVDRRPDEKPAASRWFNLDFRPFGSSPPASRFGPRIHLRLSLDGGYHVLDESTMYSSDVRPTARQLWRPHVGVLEMGILGATGLVPVKIREGAGRGVAAGGSADAYCVAKYGQKWVRTRTAPDSLCPKWNEQYAWEVFDLCTVVTVGVFDNARVDKGDDAGAAGPPRDRRIGKVRIRLSTLESDRVYTHAYPLLVLHASGVKKMGELHLALRFSCASVGNMLQTYATPLLPRMHYVQPLSVSQLESLRHQAVSAVASRLGRAEPPLGREVVEYMLDHDSNMWSMRRSKANFFRLMSVLSVLLGAVRFVEAMRAWRRPVCSAAFAAFFLALVAVPELIAPAALLYVASVGAWRYRSRPRQPPHMDARLSHAEGVCPDELDEEFDSFPTSRSAEVVRMRYDRLRSVAGRIQAVVGDMATQGERVQALLNWRDPRATFLFVTACVGAAVGFYVVSMRVVVGVWGLYALRPPRFRGRLPSRALCFFRRLPARADSML